jgi:hypothetical protein
VRRKNELLCAAKIKGTLLCHGSGLMKSVSSIFLLFLISTSSFAWDDELLTDDILDPQNDPHFNLIFGISAFDGVFGFEFQNGHHSFGVGVPTHFSYRYYFDSYQDSKFWGVYFGSYSVEDEPEELDGIVYRDFASEYYGLGGGKRWQWPSGWNVTAGVALEFYDDEYSNSVYYDHKKTRSGTFPFPTISVGYKF